MISSINPNNSLRQHVSGDVKMSLSKQYVFQTWILRRDLFLELTRRDEREHSMYTFRESSKIISILVCGTRSATQHAEIHRKNFYLFS